MLELNAKAKRILSEKPNSPSQSGLGLGLGIVENNVLNHLVFCVNIERVDKKMSYFVFVCGIIGDKAKSQFKLDKAEKKYRELLLDLDFRIEMSKFYTIISDNDEAKLVYDRLPNDKDYSFDDKFMQGLIKLELEINDYLAELTAFYMQEIPSVPVSEENFNVKKLVEGL